MVNQLAHLHMELCRLLKEEVTIAEEELQAVEVAVKTYKKVRHQEHQVKSLMIQRVQMMKDIMVGSLGNYGFTCISI